MMHKCFCQVGNCQYRPVDKTLKKKLKLPSVKKVWTVDEKLGGWTDAQKKFFDERVCCFSLWF